MSRAFVAASTQYLNNLSASPVGGLSYTIAAWFKAATVHGGALVSLAGGVANNRHLLYVKGDGKVAAFSGAGATAYETATTGSYSAGVWTHAVGAYTASGRSAFVNGVGAYVGNAANPGTMDRIHVGAYYTSGALTPGFYFNGEIADVAIWNAVIDVADIEALAAGASPLLIQPGNLAAYYPLLARGSVEEAWVGNVALTNNGTTLGASRPRILWPGWERSVVASGAVANGITITTPAAGRIHQRSGTTGTITVTGTYTGSPTSIEARLVEDGTSTLLSTFDWSTKVASPAGGTYSFSFTSVPEGSGKRFYNVQVRFGNDAGTTATSGKVGVGALVGVVGQSNAYLLFRDRATATTPDAAVRVYGNIGSWAAPDTAEMAGAIGLGNTLATLLDVPVGVLDYAYNASVLYTQWLPVSGTVNRIFTDGVAGLDDKLEAVVWIQGEGDAAAGRSQAQYYADLGTLFADWRTTSFGQASLPIVVATLARRTVAGYTDAQSQAITDAQIQKCADANIYRVDRKDLALDGDGIHHTAAAFETLGARCAQAVAYAIGEVSYYRGPSIASVTEVTPGGAVFDVNLTHRGGTDFTPPTGVTGLRFLVAGTPATINSAVQQDDDTIRVTLSASPGSMPVVQNLYGAAPTITGVVLDNSALALPLEGTNAAGVTAQSTVIVSAASGRCRARGSNTTAPISIVSAIGRRRARGSTSASQVAPDVVVTSAVGRERVRGGNTATSIRTVAVVGRRRARGAGAASSIRAQLAAGRVRARGTTTAAPIVAGTVVTSAVGRRRVRGSNSCATTRVTALAGRVRSRGSDAVSGFRVAAVSGRRRARGAASAGPAGVMVDSTAASRLWVRGTTAAVAMPPLVLVPGRVCIGARQPASVAINASILACDCN